MGMNNPYDDALASAQVVDKGHTAVEMPDDIMMEQAAQEAAEAAQKEQEEAERKRIMKMYRRFLRSQTAKSHMEAKWTEIDEFDRGEQWKGLNIPPWVPKPVTNYIRHYRTLKRANLTTAIAKATFQPVSESDKPFVARLQAAYDHVWETEKVTRTVRNCVDRAISLGTSIAMVYTDESFVGGKYFPPIPVMMPGGVPAVDQNGQPITMTNPQTKLYQGQIRVKRIPVQNFFHDPDSYRIEDSQWCEITELVAFSTIKNNKMFRDYAGDKLANMKAPRPDSESSISGDIFNRDHSITTSGTSEEGDEVVTLHTHYERYINEQGKWQMDITYYLQNGDFILHRAEDVKPSIFPFAVCYDEEEEQDFWGTSQAMTGLLEQQKIINKVQQVAATIGALHQNPQKVVQRESGINVQQMSRSSNVPGQVWASNIPKPVEVIQPPDIPRGLFELDTQTKNDSKDMMGLNEAYMGNSVGSLTTSTGVDSLIERATIRDRDKMVQIDAFVEQISHLIVLQVIHKWTEERPIPTANPDGSMNFNTWQPIDPVTADNLEWRVKSNIYAQSPVTQAARRQQADKLMQMQGQFAYDPPLIEVEEYMSQQEFPDGPKIIARMERRRAELMQQQQMMASGAIQQTVMQMAQMMAEGMMNGDPSVMEQMQPMSDQLAQQIFSLTRPPVPGAETQQTGQPPGQMAKPQNGATNNVAAANMNAGTM